MLQWGRGPPAGRHSAVWLQEIGEVGTVLHSRPADPLAPRNSRLCPRMQNTDPRAETGALMTPALEWSTSRYCDRMRRECLRAWWTLTHPRLIDYEEQVLAASRELSIYHFMDRPRLYWD